MDRSRRDLPWVRPALLVEEVSHEIFIVGDVLPSVYCRTVVMFRKGPVGRGLYINRNKHLSAWRQYAIDRLSNVLPQGVQHTVFQLVRKTLEIAIIYFDSMVPGIIYL